MLIRKRKNVNKTENFTFGFLNLDNSVSGTYRVDLATE